MFDGTQTVDGAVEYETRPVIFNIEGRQIPIIFDITQTHKNMLIIGNEWLEEFDPDISWKTKTLRWRNISPVFDNQAGCLSKKTDPLDPMAWDDYTEKVVCFISRDKPLQEAWEIPEEYLKDFPKLFRETTETVLPRHTPYDHKIPLKPGTTPPNRPLYLLSGEVPGFKGILWS